MLALPGLLTMVAIVCPGRTVAWECAEKSMKWSEWGEELVRADQKAARPDMPFLRVTVSCMGAQVDVMTTQ